VQLSEAIKPYALDAIVRGGYTEKAICVPIKIIGILIIFSKNVAMVGDRTLSMVWGQLKQLGQQGSLAPARLERSSKPPDEATRC
jgi:hypothetical protein